MVTCCVLCLGNVYDMVWYGMLYVVSVDGGGYYVCSMKCCDLYVGGVWV